jgi:thiamine biosynthesis lipoprotein
MGTRLDAVLFGDNPIALNELWRQIGSEAARLDKMLSRFDTESALYQINRDAPLYPVGTNSELWDILMDCKRYHQLTQGHFDVALGRWSQVALDETNRTVFLDGQGTHLDLGGYAKGYAMMRFRLIMEQHDAGRALINFGDSMTLALVTHPHGNHWPVSINNPYNSRPIDTFQLCDMALSVSGNTPAHPAHIICPDTGALIRDNKLIAVVARHPLDAEALSTALMAAGENNVAAWLHPFDIKEYKIYNC